MIKPTEPLDSQQRSQEMKNIVIVLRKKFATTLIVLFGPLSLIHNMLCPLHFIPHSFTTFAN